jgi:hypothetical protein
MNWQKTTEKTPKFKQIVLGLKLPNQIDLVLLDRIDENGTVFHRANNSIDFSFLSIKKTVDIDFWAEIELPETSETSNI